MPTRDQPVAGWRNPWRMLGWGSGLALLAAIGLMNVVSEDWNWPLTAFIAAFVVIGVVGGLYEVTVRLGASRAYRAGFALALVTVVLTV